MSRSFGRYRVTGTLGAGGMGEVYCAVDDVLGREVAIKTLRGNASGLAARMLDDRFRQEARAIAALHHPGVVQVFDLDLAAEPPYLVMERVAGPSLKERLANGPLAHDELRTLGIQIGRALAAAHAAGIVHRDVKPANILAAGPGVWKLADFGVAHVPDSAITMTGQFVGSPAYAPPEALVRGESAAAGDVYGLGATLYEAVAGRWPRIDGSAAALLAPLPPLATLAAVPPELAAAIDRAVALEPAERPSAAALADALAASPRADTFAGSPQAAVALPAPSVPQRRRWLPAVIALAVLVAIAVALSARTPAASVAPPVAQPPEPGPAEPEPPAPGPPEHDERKQARDWDKIREDIDKGHYEGARHRLEELEDRYGATAETSALRAQLEGLRDSHGPPRGPRKKKHGD